MGKCIKPSSEILIGKICKLTQFHQAFHVYYYDSTDSISSSFSPKLKLEDFYLWKISKNEWYDIFFSQFGLVEIRRVFLLEEIG